MNLEVSQEEVDFLKMTLNKQEGVTRVEIHHATKSFEYRDYLKQREKMIHNLLEKVKQLSPD
ncbi:MAG: hypothetical protein ABIJ37_08120 [Pseudomonadota bacterium]